MWKEGQCVFEEKKKKKKRKRKDKEKAKRIKIAMLCLETRVRSEGYMAKAFKARCPKPLLVGSHRLSARSMCGQVELSKLYVRESRNHS